MTRERVRTPGATNTGGPEIEAASRHALTQKSSTATRRTGARRRTIRQALRRWTWLTCPRCRYAAARGEFLSTPDPKSERAWVEGWRARGEAPPTPIWWAFNRRFGGGR